MAAARGSNAKLRKLTFPRSVSAPFAVQHAPVPPNLAALDAGQQLHRRRPAIRPRTHGNGQRRDLADQRMHVADGVGVGGGVRAPVAQFVVEAERGRMTIGHG